MNKPIYRYDKNFIFRVRKCLMHQRNGDEVGLDPCEKLIVRVLKNEATQRQVEVMHLYFVDELSLLEISHQLKIDISTVSRTVRRGVDHIKKAEALYK